MWRVKFDGGGSDLECLIVAWRVPQLDPCVAIEQNEFRLHLVEQQPQTLPPATLVCVSKEIVGRMVDNVSDGLSDFSKSIYFSHWYLCFADNIAS